MMKTSPCLALVCLLLLRCGSASLSPDRPRFPIEVAGTTIPLAVTEHSLIEGETDYSFTNRYGKTVYVPVCGDPFPPFLAKLVDGEWTLAWSSAHPLCRGEPLLVEPDETVTLTYRIRAGLPRSHVNPQFRAGRIAGTYRMVWSARRTARTTRHRYRR